MSALDDTMTFKPEAIAALKRFKALKTFKPEVTMGERLDGMKVLVSDLTAIYKGEDFPAPIVLMEGDISSGGFSGSSYFSPSTDASPATINMRGRLSIITLLHLFARAVRGYDPYEAQKYAVNLFRKVYPNQFARLSFNGFAVYNAPPPSDDVLDAPPDFPPIPEVTPAWADAALPADERVAASPPSEYSSEW